MTTERAPATARKGLALVLLALPSLTSSFLHSSPSSSWTARPSPALRQQQQQQPASGVRGAGGRTGVVADAAKQQQAKKEKKGAEPAEEIPLEDVMADVEKVRAAAVAEIDGAADEKALNDVRVKYLGKKGSVQAFMAMMRSLSNADKPKLGAVVNTAKEELETLIASRKDSMEGAAMNEVLAEEYIDVSLDGLDLGGMSVGHRHPLSLTTEKATNIFRSLGYDVITGAVESPEIEEDYYCFTALNCPLDHPARDMQDTFYVEDAEDADGNSKLLRTHTSAVQIREMEKRVKANDIPFRIVAPGRVYRKDEIDATHSPVFHQIEILALDEKGKLSVNHLKGTIEYFLRQMFGDEIDVRYRGSYFPFTEPSMEVDVFYKGRWLEVLGCGMVGCELSV
jgi:phenylalanyl-tRNA synthetase alpha chain